MQLSPATIRRLRDRLLETAHRPTPVVSSAYEVLTREGLLSAEEITALARIDPVAEVMFLAMASDGKVTEEEHDAITGAVRELSHEVLHPGTIKVMLQNYARSCLLEGRDQRLRLVANNLSDRPDEAAVALELAAALVVADGEVAELERTFMSQLAEWLGFEPREVDAALESLSQDQANA